MTHETVDPAAILREVAAMRRSFEARLADRRRDAIGSIGDVQAFLAGEAVLGRYAIAQVEKRLTAIETRLAALETRA
ncbi:hypothetical protein [Methylobacterium sp. JK268]